MNSEKQEKCKYARFYVSGFYECERKGFECTNYFLFADTKICNNKDGIVPSKLEKEVQKVS